MSEGDRLAKVLLFFGLLEDETKTVGKIICPFHEDVNPSMMYDLRDGSWYCLGCGLGGSSAVDFIQQMAKEKNKKANAMKVLFKILKSKEISKLQMTKRISKKIDFELELLRAKDYYYGLSKTTWGRNYSDEQLLIIDYMNKRGFAPEVLTKYGARYTYNDIYPIVFPLLDNGIFKGYVCRTINNEHAESKRKYLYNEGFRRKLCLCGTYTQDETVIIVEGYMDMLKLKTFGVKNVVAILGWKISEDQIKLLKDKNIKNVICCLDNDKAGMKGLNELKKHFDVLEFVYKKGTKDPGEMSRQEFVKQMKLSKQNYKKGRKQK